MLCAQWPSGAHTHTHTHTLCNVTYAALINIHVLCSSEALTSGLPDSKSSGMRPISAVLFSPDCVASVGTLPREYSGNSDGFCGI